MSLALFYDTETTGLPDYKAPSESAHQPRIVQLAALLVDMDTRKTIQSMDVIVCPNGWEIPADAAALHGITTEYASEVGVPENIALEMFMDLWSGRNRIAHNEKFDARIIRIALMRYQTESAADIWKSGPAECTARMTSPICQLPPTQAQREKTSFKTKTPNLGEAYLYFFGKEMENAHSAMADVQACRDVYFAALDHMEGAAA